MDQSHTGRSDTYCDIIAWEIFESYAKKTIRNRGRNLRRSLIRRLNRDSILENLENQENPENLAQFETYADHYASDDYHFQVGDKTYSIHNEYVYSGLLRLPDSRLGALVMYYWELWSDEQIGMRYDVTSRTIRNWRSQSIEQLRRYIEGEKKDEPDN